MTHSATPPVTRLVYGKKHTVERENKKSPVNAGRKETLTLNNTHIEHKHIQQAKHQQQTEPVSQNFQSDMHHMQDGLVLLPEYGDDVTHSMARLGQAQQDNATAAAKNATDMRGCHA